MKRFLLLLAFCLAALVGPVLAQEVQSPPEGTPTISNLEIALWSEFDRPEVLIIYRGLFASDTPLPVSVELRVPARVGRPTAVAYVGEDGGRFNQEYTTRVEDDWLVVSFELATLGFQLEYYDELPVDSTDWREFAYTYTADYPITALSLEFQVPPTAESFTLDPPADSVVVENDGLTYHLVQEYPVRQGEAGDWTFAYQKADSALTIEGFVQDEIPVPAESSEAGSADNTTVLIFLVAFVALIGVGAGAFWLGRRTEAIPQTASPPSRRPKRRGSGRGVPPQQQLPPSGRDETLFCHKCGTQLRSDSDFCHKCGTVVRKG